MKDTTLELLTGARLMGIAEQFIATEPILKESIKTIRGTDSVPDNI